MIEIAQILIQAGVGITMVAFGVHQILRPKVWFDHVPTIFEKIIPEKLEIIGMRLHGSANLILGILFGFGVAISFVPWITAVWWISILPFAFLHDWRDGMRDLTIISAIIAFAMNT